jgi:MazG family protein
MSKSQDQAENDDAEIDHETTKLLAIMKKLRDPDGGCPWDLEQDFSTIAPYTIEEAYEVSDAIERGDFADLRDELGDLLLQVVFHARMAEETGHFAYKDVVAAICDKMVRRHPHVFSTKGGQNASGVRKAWEDIKREERAGKAEGGKTDGLLDDVPNALPALMRAIKLQNRAAEVGFDWPSPINVVEKIAEESAELVEASAEQNPAKIAEEFGDLLFAFANLARHLKVDPEAALRAANTKFVRRFKAIEGGLQARGISLEEASLDQMEALWNEAKRGEA